MTIHETVISLGIDANKACEDKDLEAIKKISEKCFDAIDDQQFSILDNGILAYFGATSYNNYIKLMYNGALLYSLEENNEEYFEICFLLYRKSINYLSEYTNNNDTILDSLASFRTASIYLSSAHTNLANLLGQCGRLITALSYLNIEVKNEYPMAIGNLAGFLMDYTNYIYDDGHKGVFIKESYQLLKEVLQGSSEFVHSDALTHYKHLIDILKSNFSLDYLETPNEFDDFKLGDSDEEIYYRKWCLKHVLFLNPLNDVYNHSIKRQDILHLPTIVTDSNEGPRLHGLFNQIKQEYVSARYMIFDALNNPTHHFSDKDVYIVNTLDYPTYGIGIEKMKYAYRSLYSLFDRLSYLVNDYFELGIKEHDVSHRSIWSKEIVRGKKTYKLNVNLKEKMTTSISFNLPLIGLYWLCKDISKQQVKHNYLDPKIEQIAKIRHHIEHRYFKVHDNIHYPGDNYKSNNDPLAYSITFEEFHNCEHQL